MSHVKPAAVLLGLALWLPAPAGQAAESADVVAGYTAVQRAFLREAFEDAAAMAQAFATQHPQAAESPRVEIWLALSLDRLQRTQEALEALERLKRRLPPAHPDWAEVLYWEGDISRRAYQVVRARMAFQRLLSRYPSSTWAPQARLGLGLVALHQQVFDQALDAFRDVVRAHPDTPAARDALLFQGACHLRLQQHDQAVAVLEPLVAQLREPVMAAQAAVYLGESLTALGQYDRAAAAYERALASAPESMWGGLARFGLGWAWFRAGRCRESLQAFDEFLGTGGGRQRPEALFAQGACLRTLGRESEGVKRFERVMGESPQHPLALESALAVIDVLCEQNRFGDAKQRVHALFGWPIDERTRSQLQLRLGTIALAQGNIAQARTVCELAAKSDDPSVRQAAVSGLGDVALAGGDSQEARQRYDEALTRDPNTLVGRYARYQLGRLALQAGKFDAAMAAFQEVLTAGDADLADDATLALALTYLQRGEVEVARTHLEAVRGRGPDEPVAARAAYYLALASLEAQDGPAAQRFCEEVLRKAPRSEEAIDARLLLADLMAQTQPIREVMAWLEGAARSQALPVRHRAKIAKRLGDLARQEDAYPEALRWYDEAERILPALRGEIAYRVASCYEQVGDFDVAIERYQAARQPPWRVRGLLAAAKLLERQERWDAAAALYKRVVEEGTVEAALARERLVQLRAEDREEE